MIPMIEEGISSTQKAINTVIEFFVNYSFQVLGALIILLVGFIVSNWLSTMTLQFCQKKKLDITFSKFLASVVKVIIFSFSFIIALNNFGITITPFIAAISAAAFGASFAIQGPLSNYGAGLSIIMSRPFSVGNTISVAGVHGVVEDVKLACTILTDEDGVRIVIPNKHIVGEIIHNSRENKISESTFGISYDSDPEKAIQIIEKVLADSGSVSKTPKPQVGIQEFGDYTIDIGYRYWVPTIRYFQSTTKINLEIYKAMIANQVSIPYPRMDIHLLSKENPV